MSISAANLACTVLKWDGNKEEKCLLIPHDDESSVLLHYFTRSSISEFILDQNKIRLALFLNHQLHIGHLLLELQGSFWYVWRSSFNVNLYEFLYIGVFSRFLLKFLFFLTRHIHWMHYLRNEFISFNCSF